MRVSAGNSPRITSNHTTHDPILTLFITDIGIPRGKRDAYSLRIVGILNQHVCSSLSPQQDLAVLRQNTKLVLTCAVSGGMDCPKSNDGIIENCPLDFELLYRRNLM